MLSGEGKTDLGQMVPGVAGLDYIPGPMACLIDRLVEELLGYSLLDTQAAGGDCLRLISETDLAEQGKSGPRLLAGIKHGKGNALFQPYEQCEGLEDAPGNDGSPNALKPRLFKLIGHDPTAAEQAAWITSGRIDPSRIEMPSFDAFCTALQSALDAAFDLH